MSAGMERNASPVLDRNDPNYESDAEAGLLRSPSIMQSQPVKRYKEAVRSHLCIFPALCLPLYPSAWHRLAFCVAPPSCRTSL